MSNLLDSRQLLAFDSLVETRSFTETARRLNLTQSAISHSIRNLEKDLDCQLVQRTSRGLIITREGQALHASARRIIREMQDTRLHIQTRSDWGKGRLQLGASTTACQYLLPVILREFKECFPDCVLSIQPGDTPQLIEKLYKGEIDMAVIIAPEEAEDLDIRPLFRDEMIFVTSPIHPWATRGRIERTNFEDERFVLYNKTSQTFRIIEKFLEQENIRIRQSIELASMEAIKELVKINFGVSILASWIVEKEINDRSLSRIPFGRKKIFRDWSIAFLKGRKLSILEETLLGISESVAETHYRKI